MNRCSPTANTEAQQADLDTEKIAAVAELVEVIADRDRTRGGVGSMPYYRRQHCRKHMAVATVLYHILGRRPSEEEIVKALDAI